MIMSKSQATPALPVCVLQPRVQGSQSESKSPGDQIKEIGEDLEVIYGQSGSAFIWVFLRGSNLLTGVQGVPKDLIQSNWFCDSRVCVYGACLLTNISIFET